MKITKKIKKYKAKASKYFFAWTRYTKYIKKLHIQDNLIMVEADGGGKFDGSCYYIVKELGQNAKYANFKVNISVRQRLVESTKQRVAEFNANNNLNVIALRDKNYYKTLASAKYFFTDTSMHPHFIKKNGQIIVNMWHGTPLKTLGKYDKETFYRNGNLFKSFLLSDYLLAPSKFVEEKLIDSMQTKGLWNGKVLYGGYPRNSALFDEDGRKELREKLEINDKRIYIYMPTFRGNFTNQSAPTTSIEIPYYLLRLDEKLNDDDIVYVKLHPYDGGRINYRVFKHIKPFPRGYETYQFLNIADVLITDYSSVMFDFACTNRKTILFAYDKDKYLANRGMYLDIDEDLPFPKVYTIDDLYKEMVTPKQYNDKKFINRFCRFDSINASEQILDAVTTNNGKRSTNLNMRIYKDNGKKNVILYAGATAKNGLTSSLTNLLNSIDTTKYNYLVTYPANKVKVDDIREFTSSIPDSIRTVGTIGKMNTSLTGKLLIHLYKRKRKFTAAYMAIMKKYYALETMREFGNLRFVAAIQFNGYEWRKQLLFSAFDSTRSIFIHSNMGREISLKGNQSRSVLRYCYAQYDNVVAVSQEVARPTINICHKCTPVVLNNIMDIGNIMKKAKEQMHIDNYTTSNMNYEEIATLLNNKDRYKIMTIGRFSPEKDHLRLVEQFEKTWLESKSATKPILIIIGGPGPRGRNSYPTLIDYLANSPCNGSVILIQSVSNPYPFLRLSDGFILPSHYEGQSIALMEAIALGLPTVATMAPGLEGFMKEHGGSLVPDTDDGVYDGLKLLLEKKAKIVKIDFEKRKKESVAKFYDLLTERTNDAVKG